MNNNTSPHKPKKKEDVTDDSIKKLPLLKLLQENVVAEDIPCIRDASKFQQIFTLFRELTRLTVSDFLVEMGILLSLAQNTQKVIWTPQEINQEFHWIQDGIRKKIMAQLTKSNWVMLDSKGYRLTAFGRSLLSLLNSLMEQENTNEHIQDSLSANVSSLAMAEMTQTNPANTLRMFLNELLRIDQDIATTLESKSEHHIRKISRRVRSQFSIAIRSREHLKNLPSNDFAAYRLKQDVHERLSSFHSRLSSIQRAQNDLVARRIILADKSLTQHDIAEFLVCSSIQEIAHIGHKSIGYPIHVQDMIPRLLIHEAEWYLEKDRTKEERRSWTDLEMANESQESVAHYSRFLQFAGELNQKFSTKESFSIEETVPKENWTNSSFRFCMLSVLESGQIPGDLVGDLQVSCPKLKITPPSLPDEAVAILNDATTEVKELSRGIIEANTSK